MSESVIEKMAAEAQDASAGRLSFNEAKAVTSAALAAAEEAGWVLVPKEPTLEMLHAADDCDGGAYDQSASGSIHWRAMLEKAPKP